MRIKASLMSCLIAVPLVFLSPCPVSGEDTKGKEATFTIDQRGGYVIIPVMVDGKGPLRIVFDTGATDTGINPSAYRKLGLKQGSHKIKIGDFEFESSRFRADPNPVPGFDGIMGFDVMADYIISLNIREKKLIFYEKNGWTAPKMDEGSTTKKVKYTPAKNNGVECGMMLNVTVNDKGPLKVLVDTGCAAALWLLPSTARKVGLSNASSAKPVQTKIKVVDGVEYDQSITIVEAAPNLEQARAMTGVDGVFGGNFLKNFVVTFDTVNKEIYFQPHQAAADKDKK